MDDADDAELVELYDAASAVVAGSSSGQQLSRCSEPVYHQR